jgi:dimethylhistidine N-methyltransferase
MLNDAGIAARFDRDVAALALCGLSETPKTLPAKLFYDEEGSRLFRLITALPEYYLTRTEHGLLREIASDVARAVPPGSVLVEYGANDEAKAAYLLDVDDDASGMPVITAYAPIDVAGPSLVRLQARLRRSRPALAVVPIAADFTDPIALPSSLAGLTRLGFFPGSTIGNLDPLEAIRFLDRARATLGRDARFLVGFDLRKDPARLVAAYDDADRVTAAFNRNLLARLNREADGGFDLSAFAHRAVWNETEGRIEMHLVSLREQSARLAGEVIRFARGETIHTENSYKYTIEGFAHLARAAHWSVARSWTDPARLFALQLLEPEGRA